MKIHEYDVITNETILRDPTEQELAQKEIDLTNELARKAEAEAKATARQALLSKLGITQEEAQLLLGGK